MTDDEDFTALDAIDVLDDATLLETELVATLLDELEIVFLAEDFSALSADDALLSRGELNDCETDAALEDCGGIRISNGSEVGLSAIEVGILATLLPAATDSLAVVSADKDAVLDLEAAAAIELIPGLPDSVITAELFAKVSVIEDDREL